MNSNDSKVRDLYLHFLNRLYKKSILVQYVMTQIIIVHFENKLHINLKTINDMLLCNNMHV